MQLLFLISKRLVHTKVAQQIIIKIPDNESKINPSEILRKTLLTLKIYIKNPLM